MKEVWTIDLSNIEVVYKYLQDCDNILSYNAERTLCDLFRVDMETQKKQFAVKEYFRGKKDLPRLMEYAKILRVEKRMMAMFYDMEWEGTAL